MEMDASSSGRRNEVHTSVARSSWDTHLKTVHVYEKKHNAIYTVAAQDSSK